MGKINRLLARTKAAPPLETPTDLSPEAVVQVAEALNNLLADTYALYFKTKNFHWHVSGPHFRDYHLLFDEQAKALLDITDELAERVRKVGGMTLHSIGHVGRLQRVRDNDLAYVPPREMLRELMADNKAMMVNLRDAHEIADSHDDVGTTSMLEIFIDGAEKRNWFLFEASRHAEHTGH